MTIQTQARPQFAATLRPHRSMGRKGVGIVVALAAVLSTIPGIIFFSMGAWPVIGFMGLDILLVWWALTSSLGGGKQREEVRLWPGTLEITRVSVRGKEELLRFDPLHTRLVVDRDINERTVGLKLRTGQGDTAIGGFLSPDEKSSFAKAFGTALKRVRQHR